MKEILNEIEKEFLKAIETELTGAELDYVKTVYTKVSRDVFLEKLSQLNERQN